MKRILIVETGAGFGGALTSLETLVSHLDASRWEIHVLTAYPQDCIVAGGAVRRVGVLSRNRRYGPKAGLEARLRPFLGSRAGNAAFLADFLTTGRRFASAVAGYAREHHVDLIQGNNGVLINDAAILAARSAGLPCVIHSRGAEYPGRLGRLLARGVARTLAVSAYVARTVQALGVGPDRIALVPEGLDAATFAAGANAGRFRVRHGLPADLPLVGMVGCLTPWKGHDVFLAACAQALPAGRAGALVIGGDPDGSGRELGRLRAKARDFGIGDRVWFTGHETDVASGLAACQAAVHASIEPEPFGRVLLEAMALGLPVVAARGGGPREVIDADVDGLLVTPGDASALATAIRLLIENPEMRDRMGAAGLAKVRTHYTMGRHVREVEAVWETLLS